MALGYLGALSGSPVVLALLSGLAFFLAGALTIRWVRLARPIDPAVGAALATAIALGLQIGLARAHHRLDGISSARLAGAFAVTLVFAFLLSSAGARLVFATRREGDLGERRPTRRGQIRIVPEEPQQHPPGPPSRHPA